MSDPRGTTQPVASGAQHRFLDELAQRVLIFDGAFGTWMQAHDLGPDDFGGEALEGCNEQLVLTRPDLVTRMHEEFFAVGVDAVETATFGAFPLVLNEYGIAEKTFEMNQRAAELARTVAADCSTPDRPRFVIGSMGPGTRLPSLGQIPHPELRDRYPLQAEGLVAAATEAHGRFVHEFGLNIVGGCCGTTPEHLAQVVGRVGNDRAPEIRTPEHEPGCSSIYSHVPFHQELAYLAVGERTNANGSRKFRDAMLEADWDTCVQMAREQVKEGAHVLDVCVDYVGRGGTLGMDEIAGRLATQASLPLVFDSTEPQVVEAGLRHHGGKAILNS